MATFLFTWDPDAHDNKGDKARSAAEVTALGGVAHDRGAVASARVACRPATERTYADCDETEALWRPASLPGHFLGPHWQDPEEIGNYIRVDWELWLPVERRLPIETLDSAVPSRKWLYLQGNGLECGLDEARELASIWQRHAEDLGITVPAANELRPTETFVEGATTRVTVNRYERDPRARRACIAYWGVNCAVCDLNFGEMYGPEAEGFINVHHVVDLSVVGANYEIDPRADLRPVCPNCHSMLHHRRQPAMDIDDLRRRLH